MRFKLALISKGLRRWFVGQVGHAWAFQACPDFKGIKTHQAAHTQVVNRFKLALISKGLRRHVGQ